MDHKNGKWARQILESRNREGLWGNFHTLSQPVPGRPLTTEQAIRRLRILGYTKDDAPIQTVLTRMCQCVRGERKIDSYFEKKHDWPLFEKLMLSAWIRLFDPDNADALTVARQWAGIAEQAFRGGAYSGTADCEAFTACFGRKPKSGFETGFGMFYHAALLQGVLTPETESRFLDYSLARPDGIYYIYGNRLLDLPAVFASRQASHYLAALEVLSGYPQAPRKLQFAAAWLEENRDETGGWDMGAGAKDDMYFPLSDSWRSAAQRKADCTERIGRLLQRLAPAIGAP